MQRKHLFALIAVLIIAVMALSACGGGNATQAPAQEEKPAATEAPAAEATETPGVEPAKEIVFYNWSEYIDPDVYKEFEDATGIHVVEDNFSSNEELTAKLQGGVTGYAVIVPSDYAVGSLIEQGLLAPLDHDNIPNLKNLAKRFTEVPFDPGNKYCVPYQWGTTGIGYESSQIEPPDSWSAIFEATPDDPWYGRMTMLDDARESFAAALAYLNYDINSTDEAQLEEAKNLLIKAKPGLARYDSTPLKTWWPPVKICWPTAGMATSWWPWKTMRTLPTWCPRKVALSGWTIFASRHRQHPRRSWRAKCSSTSSLIPRSVPRFPNSTGMLRPMRRQKPTCPRISFQILPFILLLRSWRN